VRLRSSNLGETIFRSRRTNQGRLGLKNCPSIHLVIVQNTALPYAPSRLFSARLRKAGVRYWPGQGDTPGPNNRVVSQHRCSVGPPGPALLLRHHQCGAASGQLSRQPANCWRPPPETCQSTGGSPYVLNIRPSLSEEKASNCRLEVADGPSSTEWPVADQGLHHDGLEEWSARRR